LEAEFDKLNKIFWEKALYSIKSGFRVEEGHR
jgi:hypothetical protein